MGILHGLPKFIAHDPSLTLNMTVPAVPLEIERCGELLLALLANVHQCHRRGRSEVDSRMRMGSVKIRSAQIYSRRM